MDTTSIATMQPKGEQAKRRCYVDNAELAYQDRRTVE